VPTLIEHIDKKLSSTLQFYNVAINPVDSNEGYMGGTQDKRHLVEPGRSPVDRSRKGIYGDGG